MKYWTALLAASLSWGCSGEDGGHGQDDPSTTGNSTDATSSSNTSAGPATSSTTGGSTASSGSGGSTASAATSGSGGSAATSGSGGSGGEATSTANATGAGGGGGDGPALGEGLCGAAEGQLFGPDHPWNEPVDEAPLDSESDAIISYLENNHNGSGKFRVDGPSDQPDSLYGITLMSADASTPREPFDQNGSFYSPDCDTAEMPIPAVGATEGEEGYACESDGDCHLLVVDTDECRLFEMYRADRNGPGVFNGGCLAVWDLSETYTPTLRGDYCTSADAAGLPIAAHMFSADDIAAGRINHAIRFILPNANMQNLVYVRPATHSTSATSGPGDAPPYGARLRLKADFDMDGLNEAARVVARALQTYGMILSDGGNITFTALNDRFTEHKWAEVGFGPGDLESLRWTDFEVPELGERMVWDGDCEHTPVTE